MEQCFCGRNFGEHHYEFDIVIKPNCVACGNLIKGQCEEAYFLKGNYCSTCNNKCAVKTEYNTKREDFIRALFKNK